MRRYCNTGYDASRCQTRLHIYYNRASDDGIILVTSEGSRGDIIVGEYNGLLYGEASIILDDILVYGSSHVSSIVL